MSSEYMHGSARGNLQRMNFPSGWTFIQQIDTGRDIFSVGMDPGTDKVLIDIHVEHVGPDFDAAYQWAREIAAEEQKKKLAGRVRPFSERPEEGQVVEIVYHPPSFKEFFQAVFVGGRWYFPMVENWQHWYAGWRPKEGA